MSDAATHGVPGFELRHRLARALEFSGVKVGEMGAYLEVSDSTMTNYLSGRTKPGKGALIAWALRTGVPYEWLATGTTPDTGPDGGSSQDGPITLGKPDGRRRHGYLRVA